MTNDQLAVLKKFPLLLPQNKCFTRYDGFICAGGEEFQISLKVPHYPALTQMSVYSSWELNYILRSHTEELLEWSNSCPTLSMYLERLQNLIISSLKTKSSLLNHGESLNEDGYQRILSDLEAVGLKHVMFLSRSLKLVKLKSTDETGHCHVLTVGLGASYPHQSLLVNADLPQQTLAHINKNSSLVNVYRSFVQQVTALQGLWTILNSLDADCWVLDPEHPTRKDTSRRIVIGTNVSVHVTFDPSNITERPNITFLGPDSLVAPFRESLVANLEGWHTENSVVANLQRMLGLTAFPTRPSQEEQDTGALVQQGECCICYAQRLEGELPTLMCDDQRCASPFHTACLFQWLQTVPGNYQSFNRIYGDCPNCGKAISCPVST